MVKSAAERHSFFGLPYFGLYMHYFHIPCMLSPVRLVLIRGRISGTVLT